MARAKHGAWVVVSVYCGVVEHLLGVFFDRGLADTFRKEQVAAFKKLGQEGDDFDVVLVGTALGTVVDLEGLI